MGDRGQVLIKDTGVYLYTHWGATELIDTVKKAIAKKWRWTDEEYLTRIIFSEMVKGEEEGETGYGIGTQEHEDIWRLITVDCENQKITIKDDEEKEKQMSFEDFIKLPDES